MFHLYAKVKNSLNNFIQLNLSSSAYSYRDSTIKQIKSEGKDTEVRKNAYM
jgi:hypothetical protein